MFSPKIQRPIRVNDVQVQILGERARYDATISGSLYKRTSDGSKWQLRWFTLYQVFCNFSSFKFIYLCKCLTETWVVQPHVENISLETKSCRILPLTYPTKYDMT